MVGASARAWLGRAIAVYESQPSRLKDHPVVEHLIREGNPIYLLAEPFDAFEAAYPFLCAKEHSSKAHKRSLCPSCIIPGLLYLGDLTDAAALPRLREQLNIQQALTALAELPESLRSAVKESGVTHTWCNVRDVEEADIKSHFSKAIERIEAARQGGHAIFIHCSRGVSRSASLCIAYLMKTNGWSAKRARDAVEACRPIILPNDGFVKCLLEFEKELSGARTGVYAPAPKSKRVEELDCEFPPPWAAEPTQSAAELVVEKNGQVVETLPIGDHSVYTFGRSLTCDFPIEHPSASRNHAALVHHENGGVYVIDLQSSHGTHVNGRPIKPFEACLLRDGSTVAFGASTRLHRLQGCQLPSHTVPAPRPAEASGSQSAVQGPALPGEEPPGGKRKFTPSDAKAKRVKRWLGGGEKAKAQMSENDRVARGAGAGSGCFGPG